MRYALLPAAGLLLLNACASRPASLTALSEDYDEQRDYFPDKLAVKYARGFSVAYERNYKIVRTNASAP